MMTTPAFTSVEEAFLYCRDLDASLAERLDAFSLATRYLIPGYQEDGGPHGQPAESLRRGSSGPQAG